jgi:uncharacterized protein (DUF1778 family)
MKEIEPRKVVTLRLANDERDLIAGAAGAAGERVSVWMRRTLLDSARRRILLAQGAGREAVG